jgi:hypothetical protein
MRAGGASGTGPTRLLPRVPDPSRCAPRGCSFISEAIPLAPGSRHVRDLFRGDGAGPFEKTAIDVVAAAREVDALLAQIIQSHENIADAKARLPEAVRLWRETLERVAATDARSMIVTASSNGTVQAASGDDAD